MTEEAERLHITSDDLYLPEVEARVNQLKEARSVPLVRQVGDPGGNGTPWYRNLVLNMLAAGLVGGLVAWGLIEIEANLLEDSDNTTLSNVMFTMLIGFGIGLVLAVWDGLVAGSVARAKRTFLIAVPALLVLTLAFGFLANAIYSDWTDSIAREAQDKILDGEFDTESEFISWLNGQLHLPRGIAWSLVGLAAGLAVGIASLKWQRMVNGAVGGLVGGFLGGFLFDYFTSTSESDSGVLARGIGTALTGILIGLGFGLIELARRQHWLEIVTGGMAGKQFILYGGRTTLGASSANDVTLIKDPGILPQHLVLTGNGNALTAQATQAGAPFSINGIPTDGQQLRDGDTLQLGSTLLRYRNRAEEKVASGPIVG
jgi:hypothetical protein